MTKDWKVGIKKHRVRHLSGRKDAIFGSKKVKFYYFFPIIGGVLACLFFSILFFSVFFVFFLINSFAIFASFWPVVLGASATTLENKKSFITLPVPLPQFAFSDTVFLSDTRGLSGI